MQALRLSWYEMSRSFFDVRKRSLKYMKTLDVMAWKVITKKYFLLLTFFTSFHSRGEHFAAFSFAPDSCRRNEISLVDFQHEIKIMVTFSERSIVNIKHVRCPGQALSGVWPPFSSSSSLGAFAREPCRLPPWPWKHKRMVFKFSMLARQLWGPRSAALRPLGSSARTKK